MWDPSTIGTALAAVLAPRLATPGEAVTGPLRPLWRRLSPALHDTRDAAGAIATLSANPGNPAARTVLGDEIRLLLDADPALLRLAVALLERGAPDADPRPA